MTPLACRDAPASAAAPAFTDSYATKKQTFLQVLAVRSDEIDTVLNLKFSNGRTFAPAAPEIVFGADIKDKLQRNEGIRIGDIFTAMVRDYDGNGMPVDRQVPLSVVGALGDRNDQFDRYVLVDMATASRIRGIQKSYDTVYIRVDNPDAVFTVVNQISAQGLEAKGAFEQIRAVNQFMDAILIVFMLFAAFALVVGGLMITTTMITSVYERTREIGITMAVGASENDVIRMVMYECLLLGIIGGIVRQYIGFPLHRCAQYGGKALYHLPARPGIFQHLRKRDRPCIPRDDGCGYGDCHHILARSRDLPCIQGYPYEPC